MEDSIREYEIKRVLHRPADKAARYALQPVTADHKAVEPEKGARGDTAVRLAILHLLKTWRARCQVLRKRGWKRIEDKQWFYCVNCPPIGVATQHRKAFTCQNAQICPFCWCRQYVYDTYERLRFAFYGHVPDEPRIDPYTQEEEKILPRAMDLLEVVTWVRQHRDKVEVPQLFAENIAAARNNFVRRIDALGAFQLYTIEPSDPRDPYPHWLTKQRILAMVVPGHPTPPDLDSKVIKKITAVLPASEEGYGRSFKRHTGIDQQTLIAAVGRISAYPSQMLRGAQDDTVDILNFINSHGSSRKPKPGDTVGPKSGFRMSAFYGILRNKTQRLIEKRMGIY